MRRSLIFIIGCFLLQSATAQDVQETKDSTVLSNGQVRLVVDHTSGKLSYYFKNGVQLLNTTAYVEDVHAGYLGTADFSEHHIATAPVQGTLGKGLSVQVEHTDTRRTVSLIQHIILYENQPFLLISVEAVTGKAPGALPETRNISPLAVSSKVQGRVIIPGTEPRILDVPFDNDNWVKVLTQAWPAAGAKAASGVSYEFSALYDNNTFAGLVAGSITHDTWKTGIAYHTALAKGELDTFNIYGGAATADNKALPPAYGGLDGTHDHAPHGTLQGGRIQSPVIYLAASADTRQDFVNYGNVNVKQSGRLEWKGYAPFYWNSFGVEGVLGYEKVMMPPGVAKVSDLIATLDNFNKYAKPVLSIDSYDQNIYTTDLLASLGKYAKKRNQELGFYFIPFAVWTWKNNMDQTKLNGTSTLLRDVVLKGSDGQPIAYKDGDWGAFAIDPTHPAVKEYIIGQLKKAKAINASFIKIDFLTAGSLESVTRYDKNVRTGMQAYNQGMKMLKSLMDSIMGPDIFITMAISPMFPHQYAHTRFVSTDVYSHLRDDQPGFPGWGSTESSLATGSHMWWMQGTLWPYTNLDVAIMKHFQKNPDLSEQEIKVRLYAMMVMGSILGDGSDLRDKVAAERAKRYLNNPELCAFFSQPKVFTPLRMADGETMDQQLSFYLKGDTTMLALFNFATQKEFRETIHMKDIGLADGRYELKDLLTGQSLGQVSRGQQSISLAVPVKDAILVKCIPLGD
ncbi:hypothetical protein F0L74_11995 [Chitinophaga agrisoli]|uniref:Alpha-galactosidase n=1 Tax=Chitinophaga agrisoli TaxID=2607653 RepID=A0A5B2VX99_9BACT|nr:hypothetical protein [Chitinophaga agrisoli]KAA2243230.1 hypothetical protein F0L74_11995 [Chitinophaga agrisoli]